jgi:hypothetical protein
MAVRTEYHIQRRAYGVRATARPGSGLDDFYEGALLDGDLALYRQARAQSGLDGEIALLRLRLYRLLHERIGGDKPDSQALTTQVLRIIDLLVKAVRAHGAGTDQEQAALERELDEAALRIFGTVQK